jgi:hypothetical protein
MKPFIVTFYAHSSPHPRTKSFNDAITIETLTDPMIATPIHIPLHNTMIRSFYETTTKPLTEQMAIITMCNPNHNPVNTPLCKLETPIQ